MPSACCGIDLACDISADGAMPTPQACSAMKDGLLDTIRNYLVAIGGFTTWLCERRKAPRAHPLASVTKPSPAKEAQVRAARTLSADEWPHLVDSDDCRAGSLRRVRPGACTAISHRDEMVLRSNELRGADAGKFGAPWLSPVYPRKAPTTTSQGSPTETYRAALGGAAHDARREENTRAPVFDDAGDPWDMAATIRADLAACCRRRGSTKLAAILRESIQRSKRLPDGK